MRLWINRAMFYLGKVHTKRTNRYFRKHPTRAGAGAVTTKRRPGWCIIPVEAPRWTSLQDISYKERCEALERISQIMKENRL
jgi:hypothetical protein